MGDDPDMLVVLTTARTEFEAEALAEALRARGIRVAVFGDVARTIVAEAECFGTIKVMVRRADVRTAHQIKASLKADSVDIDWDDVETGDTNPADAAAERSGAAWSARQRGRTMRWKKLESTFLVMLIFLAFYLIYVPVSGGGVPPLWLMITSVGVAGLATLYVWKKK